ncbi:CCZ1/INTU/HSP4 first Longin domain-containing protein [Plasmodiophora brassicae]
MPTATIVGLFLACPRLSRSEDDEVAKIVAFHPAATPAAEQCRLQGLVEATQHFAREFHAHVPCDSIEYRDHKFAVVDAADGLHLALVVQHGHDCLADMHVVLRHCLGLMQMLHGPINQALDDECGVDDLRRGAQRFLDCYGACIDFGSPAINVSGEGLSYMSVDRLIYCALQCMINRVECGDDNKSGEFLCVLYAGRLLWSALPDPTCNLLLCGLEQKQYSAIRDEYCKALPSGSSDSKKQFWVFSAALPSSDGSERYQRRQVVVVRHNQLCIYFRADSHDVEVARRVLTDLDLLPLCSQLMNYAKRRSVSEAVRFIYYNGVNLAIKSSVHAGTLDPKWSPQCFVVIRAMQRAFSSRNAPVEITLQSQCSRWVIGKRFPVTDRTYFIIVNDPTNDIDQIEREVNKLEHTTLSSICLI